MKVNGQNLTTENLEHHLRNKLTKCYVIPVYNACNADCVFCVTKSYMPKPHSKKLLDKSKFHDTVKILYEHGIRSFEITGGGEPSLHPNLPGIVSSIRQFKNVKIKLYTNGQLLRDPLPIDELNISRCAVDEVRNQKIMNLSGGSISVTDLLKRLRSNNYHYIRLSVPIIKGGVETVYDAIDFINSTAFLVDGIVFRPLFPDTPMLSKYNPTEEIKRTVWEKMLEKEIKKTGANCNIEIDADSCFRESQLIIGSDGKLYSDWRFENTLFSGNLNTPN